jgi:TetR/AcrR family acrAB operon transcriptional repressor
MDPARPPRRGDRARRGLTDVAIDCFARYGFQGTSIDRIARAAGLTKGAIYYHFRDKQDLLAAAVDDRIAEFQDRVERACEGLPADRALRRIADVCIEHARSHDHPRFAITLMIETIETNTKVSARLSEMMRRFRAFLRNLVQRGQEQGLFDAAVDPEAVAGAYTSCILGAEVQYYQDPRRFRFEDSVHAYIDQLIAGLAPGAPERLTARGVNDA